MAPDAATAIDGRRARRERGRAAVIDAVVDLLDEGHAPPSARAVIERSGVSEATLFRYFDTLDDLQHAAASRFLERNAALFELAEIGCGTLDVRASRFVDARLRLYDTIAPMARLVRARSLDHPHFTATLHEVRGRLADQVALHFATELSCRGRAGRDDLVAVISTLTSFESWDQLRNDHDRTSLQVRRTWRRTVVELLR